MKVKIIIFMLLAVLALPLSALTFYKQSRVVLPEFYGVICVDDYICLEDIEKKDDAEKLYEYALSHMEKELTLLQHKPTVIFCSSVQCSERFGLKRASAINIGTFGIIISSKGWKQHLVAHEFIHYWQASVKGNFKMLILSNKSWLIEGMAYSLSDDPRLVLSEPFQSDREKFNEWYTEDKKNNIKLAFKSETNK